MDDTEKRFTSPSSCITHVSQDQGSIIVQVVAISFISKEADLQQINFDEGDPRDPKNFSYARKWAITLTCCMLAGIVGNFNIFCLRDFI